MERFFLFGFILLPPEKAVPLSAEGVDGADEEVKRLASEPVRRSPHGCKAMSVPVPADLRPPAVSASAGIGRFLGRPLRAWILRGPGDGMGGYPADNPVGRKGIPDGKEYRFGVLGRGNRSVMNPVLGRGGF